MFENGETAAVSIDLNFNRFSVKLKTDENKEWLNQLSNFKISYLPVFSSFLVKEEKRTALIIKDYMKRAGVNFVIRNLLLTLSNDAAKKQQLEAILKTAFPEIDKLAISFDEKNDTYINVTYKEKNKQKEFDIFSAGSGFQQFVYLFGFILLEEPDIILLDEPDVHLHGQLQKAFFKELKKLIGTRNAQIIFATHSRDLISQAEPENIISLLNDKPVRLKLDYQVFNTLSDLGSLENHQLLLLQEFRKVLVVENKDDWSFLEKIISLELGDKIAIQVPKRLSICYSTGSPINKDMAVLRDSLQQMFTEGGGKVVEMLAICDRDYFPEREEYLNLLNQKDNYVRYHIYEYNEWENYLLQENLLLKFIKPKSNPQMQIGELLLNEELKRLVESFKDSVNDRVVTGYEKYSKVFAQRWDTSKYSSKAREFMKNNWDKNSFAFTDAKKVLGGLSTYLQKNGYQSFSTHLVLSEFSAEYLTDELKKLARQIVAFAGLADE